MDKNLRCLVLFENSCAKATFDTYKIYLDLFLIWCHKDYKSLLLVPQKELEELLQDYCIHLRNRADSKEISPNSIPTIFNGIFKFLKVNRVKVDKESVTQLYPNKQTLGGHDAITTEQIVKLLNSCETKRDRALIHFFSATGSRPDAVSNLQLKHVSEFQDDFYKVILYSEDFKHEMTTFLHFEAVRSLKEYFEERESNGEKLTSESWLFGARSSCKSNRKKMSIDSIQTVMDRIWKRSGIKRVKHGNRFNLASTTSIRKRFDTILEMNPEVSSGASQYLMDHTGYLSGTHYRRPTEIQIFKSYRSACIELMISNELRLELEFKQKEEYLSKKEFEKDSRIRELEKRLENTDKLLQVVLSKLDNQNHSLLKNL